MMTEVCRWMSSPVMCELTGATYRQLDYWARMGVIPPDVLEDDTPGSGNPRRWSAVAVGPIRVLTDVSRAMGPKSGLTCEQMAEVFARWDIGRYVLSERVILTWTVDPASSPTTHRNT